MKYWKILQIIAINPEVSTPGSGVARCCYITNITMNIRLERMNMLSNYDLNDEIAVN